MNQAKRLQQRLSSAETLLVTSVLLLMSACSAASVDNAGQPMAQTSTVPDTATAAPANARLAGEFESRVLALLQRIAREKHISPEAVEGELGAKLDVVKTSDSPKNRELRGLFEPGHGYRIELRNRESDVQLSVSASATGASGCHLRSDPIRAVLIDQLHYKVSELGQGKRPFTLLSSPGTSQVAVRLFDQVITDANGRATNCTCLLDIAAPGS